MFYRFLSTFYHHHLISSLIRVGDTHRDHFVSRYVWKPHFLWPHRQLELESVAQQRKLRNSLSPTGVLGFIQPDNAKKSQAVLNFPLTAKQVRINKLRPADWSWTFKIKYLHIIRNVHDWSTRCLNIAALATQWQKYYSVKCIIPILLMYNRSYGFKDGMTPPIPLLPVTAW